MTDAVDLGRLKLPLLLLGGPYGNLQATDALINVAASLGISPDRMICTGDTVAYCADPLATVGRLRDVGIPVLMGNCEENLGHGVDDCGCGFEDGTACDLLSQSWYAFCQSELDDDSLAWMRDLPRRLVFEVMGARFTVVHGGASHISRFVFPSAEREHIREEAALAGGDGIVAGHSGIPFARVVAERIWINAGAIGMPANDGTPRVWFAILDEADGRLSVTFHDLDYDFVTAASTMRHKGLPEGYATCLETGLWPSQDVLPQDERLRTGVPLEFQPVSWRPWAATI